MMSKEKRRVPKLRFPGFTEDWEQRKLTSFTQRVKGNDGRMDLPTLTISASEGWLNQKDRFSANIAGSEQKNYTLLRQGELSYNHGNSKLAKYGVVYVLKDYKEALVPRVYHSFKVNESYDALFVEYYFSTKRPDRELAKLVSSGARMDGLLNIGYDEFTNISISVPTLSEQRQIVVLLTELDKFITLHQRKLDNLKLKKKALLQKLFPKNGERYPELRFPGFTDAWEQRKLGDVVKSYSGGTPTASNKEYYGGDIPFIRSAEINSDTTELYITQKGLDNSSAKIVDKGTILYAMYGATSGEVGISKINGAINQAILAMIPLEYNSRIIAQYLRKNKESIIGKYLQGGQGNLSANIILELPIQLPGLEESNQIANFLESFDNIITLHQRKLAHLKLQKKALLQQMFV